MYRRCFKRILDFLIALISLFLLSCVFVFFIVLVRLKLGSPIFFTQKRPGFREQIFTLYKFRSMVDKFDKNGEELPDAERLNSFGKWLRSTSLDELPELINILKGQMSLVGPRPLLIEYLPLYNQEQRRRHSVRPGLTGWAQVNGRNALSWEEKFKYDLEYVEKCGFFFDLKIIFLTFKKVIVKDGINSENSASSEKFTGTKK
ncbi:sugar transferase [Lentisphaerae bacterium WC36]|nr:sugar transferase [Lentisphaerae bacterium WC36]